MNMESKTNQKMQPATHISRARLRNRRCSSHSHHVRACHALGHHRCRHASKTNCLGSDFVVKRELKPSHTQRKTQQSEHVTPKWKRIVREVMGVQQHEDNEECEMRKKCEGEEDEGLVTG